MKRLLLLLVALLATSHLWSQSQQGAIQLKLIDQAEGSPLVGAVIAITNSQKETRYSVTSEEGSCNLTPLTYGTYDIQATYLGYDTIRRRVTLEQERVDLGTLPMQVLSMHLNSVTVVADAIRTTISGDTVIYNADAFKVTNDAVAEGLLAKMPGITVEDGVVEAQGETVKKVFVDGKEFFGEDVTLAVSNIPADIIAKVEVFNKLSDNAEFTGFDDGDSYKALNIVTRTGMNRGQFGKFAAGYAWENLYQASANYSCFTNNHRITLIGMANNMNAQGFGQMRVGGGGGKQMGGSSRSGISTVGALGFNYGGSFLEEKLKIEASYFYNLSNNDTQKETDRIYITDEEEMQRYYESSSQSTSENYNHRINTRFEYKPNVRHSLMMRPEVAIQTTGSGSNSTARNDESSDGVSFLPLNSSVRASSSDRDAITLSNNLVYRTLLDATGRNLLFTANGSYTQSDTYGLNSTLTSYPERGDSLVKQNNLNGSTNYNYGGSVMYSEPIFEKSAMLTLKYNVNHRFSDADYLVYQWEQEENLFNPDYDPTRSNIYNSGYTTHNVGPGFMYSKKNSLTLNANVSYQYATLSKEQEMPVIDPSYRAYTFDNVVYSFSMRKTFTPTNTLRVTMRSNTSNPSVNDLQDMIKDSNPQNVSSGNSDLIPSYKHDARITYNLADITKGRTFMAMVSGNITNNYIGRSTIMLLSPEDSYLLPNGNMLEQFGQYSRPVNLDGNWRITSSMSFGTPINPILCNLNMNIGASYGETPSIFNELENLNMTSSYNAGLSLGSNISEYVDFTLSYKAGYNLANYKYDMGTNATRSNQYLTQRASAQFKFVLWAGFTLSGNTTYSQYKGITDDFNQEYLLCNFYIGKKLFKNDRGEITIGVNDLFNQTENFSRNITSTYVENVVNNSIGRYYGIKLTYDLRSFNGQGGRGERPTRDDFGGGGGGFGGRPSGGGGGRR